MRKAGPERPPIRRRGHAAAFRRILAMEAPATYVTKVLLTIRTLLAAAIWIAVCSRSAVATTHVAAEKPAENLYLQLGEVGLDASRVYQVRGASLSRGAIQISLEDGTIGFTQDVMGRITGAF